MVKTQTSIYRMESKYNTNGILYCSENKSYILPTSMNLKKKKKNTKKQNKNKKNTNLRIDTIVIKCFKYLKLHTLLKVTSTKV